MSQLGGQEELLGTKQTLGWDQVWQTILVLDVKSLFIITTIFSWYHPYDPLHVKSHRHHCQLFLISSNQCSCVCRCRNSGVPCSTGMIFNPEMCRQELIIWKLHIQHVNFASSQPNMIQHKFHSKLYGVHFRCESRHHGLKPFAQCRSQGNCWNSAGM